jgi:hypothetical protein
MRDGKLVKDVITKRITGVDYDADEAALYFTVALPPGKTGFEIIKMKLGEIAVMRPVRKVMA